MQIITRGDQIKEIYIESNSVIMVLSQFTRFKHLDDLNLMWTFLHQLFLKTHAILGFCLALVAITDALKSQGFQNRNYAIMGSFSHLVRTFPVSASVFSSFFDDSNDKFRVDIIDRGQNYLVQAELPGLSEEDIEVNINLEDQKLTISSDINVENMETAQDKTHKFCMKERISGKLSRSLTLPPDVNIEDVSAKYKAGILEVNISKQVPKITVSKKVKIS
jgi:HSP20 family protein